MLRRVLAAVVCALVLAACQLDVDVDVVIEPDGTGRIAVVASVDREVVTTVPGIADELVLDDVVEQGWIVDGPTPTDDGGLTIALTHDFVSDQEATNLLRSLGPPFGQMTVQRGTAGDITTTRVTGLLGLTEGFQSFADEDLITAVGSIPFAEEIEASGATPDSSMTITFRVQLPGEIDEDATTGTIEGDGTVEWVVPLDNTILDLRAESTQEPSDDRWWARPLSIAALVAFIAWVVFMALFIGYVIVARWRRARNYKHRPRTYEDFHDRLGQ